MIDKNKIIKLVKQAGQLAKTDHLDTALKGKADFVTNVDLSISSFLKDRLKSEMPEFGFFSEEEEGSLKDPGFILDPIDGTTNLVYGYNLSSVSLGVYQDGRVVFGVVYNPFTEETFFASEGEGAFLERPDGSLKKLSVSDREIKDALIEFGAGSTHKELAEQNFELVKDIFKQCIDIRRICSSALDLCYIADGRIDGYFEKILKPWDIAAGSLILQEAGGKITDYSGEPVQFEKPTSVIAGNGRTNAAIQNTIKRHNA